MRLLTVAILVTFVVGSFTPAFAEDWREKKRDARRGEIDETASETLEELLSGNATARALYEKAYGWAVFDNLKIAFGISGGGGYGVAVEKASGQRVYMRMGTVGVGIGLGGNRYQVIFVFQDEATFRQFVDKGWQADAGATAAAGTEAIEGKANFTNGLAIYQVTEKGLMLNADVAGTKYWKSKKLN